MEKCTECGTINDKPLGLNRNGEPYLACCPDNNYVEMTAVEYLIEQLEFALSDIEWSNYRNETDRAKEMEKKQIIDAHENGQAEFDTEAYRYEVIANAEQYYKKTFNK